MRPTSVGLRPFAVAMVSVHGKRIALWHARRRRLGLILRLGHAGGLFLVDMVCLVRTYRRAQQKVALSLNRQRQIHVTSFN